MNKFFIEKIQIKNFKSLLNVEISDCKRINIFIGKPNVGKTNILEAMSMSNLANLDTSKFENYIRLEKSAEIFYKAKTENEIIFKFYHNDKYFYAYGIKYVNNTLHRNIPDAILSPQKPYTYEKLHYFKFSEKKNYIDNGKKELQAPYGENLISALSLNKDLLNEISALIKEFNGLSFAIDKISQRLGIVTIDEGSFVFLPFSAMADSLKRLIFYKAAIQSNKKSIILLEEPEAHLFPPYISSILQDIIKAEDSQFFLTTHSPYVISELLDYENKSKDVAIFVVDYKNEQTVVKRLSDAEMQQIWEDGIDMFYSIDNLSAE